LYPRILLLSINDIAAIRKMRGARVKILGFLALFTAAGAVASPVDTLTERSADAPAAMPADSPQPRIVSITMRDGTRLAGDLYLPQQPGQYPVIIEATPYGRRSALTFNNERAFWPAHGFAMLYVDVRGQHDSDGTFTFLNDGDTDGPDLIEWAGTQDWSNGKVGMRGSSYSGIYPWIVAKAGAPRLRCINVNAAPDVPFAGVPYSGGALMQSWAIDWIGSFTDKRLKPGTKVDYDRLRTHRPLMTLDEAAYGVELKTYRDVLRHPTSGAFWKSVKLTPADYARIDIPSLAFVGWFDGSIAGTVRHYRSMKAYSPAAADQFLVVGPWDHATASDGGWDFVTGKRAATIGNLRLPDRAFLPGQRMTLAFFDWCLKDGPRPNMPSAQLYVTGADRWVSRETYVSADTQRTALYLDAGKRLSAARGSGVADRYVYDPAQPAPVPINSASFFARPDVLTYTSGPFASPATLLGEIILELHAASSARDTDFVARIEDVAPDGQAAQIGSAPGIIRARFRNGFDREVLLTPGKVERYSLSLGEVGHQLAPGHRIRLSITSSAYPLISINPNTGNPIASDIAAMVPATQTIFHNSRRSSRLLLPIVTLPPVGAER
jgi:uncharacterized protein